MPETKVTTLESSFLQKLIADLEAAGETVLAAVLQALIAKVGTKTTA
jgi:hypothetical protein